MSKIIRYFPDTHLGAGHDGLSKIARHAGHDPAELRSGEYLIFVNRSKTGVKLFAPNNTIAYYKHKGKLDLRTIAKLPYCFSGGRINYDKALTKVLAEDLTARRNIE